MLTLVRAPAPSARAHRCSWNSLPRAAEPPRLRLVGADPEPESARRATGRAAGPSTEPTAEQREVLAIALDRMIDEALRQLAQERSLTRARLAAAAPTR